MYSLEFWFGKGEQPIGTVGSVFATAQGCCSRRSTELTVASFLSIGQHHDTLFGVVIAVTLQLSSKEILFGLSDLLDKQWSQVSSLFPPRCVASSGHFHRVGL